MCVRDGEQTDNYVASFQEKKFIFIQQHCVSLKTGNTFFKIKWRQKLQVCQGTALPALVPSKYFPSLSPALGVQPRSDSSQYAIIFSHHQSMHNLFNFLDKPCHMVFFVGNIFSTPLFWGEEVSFLCFY